MEELELSSLTEVLGFDFLVIAATLLYLYWLGRHIRHRKVNRYRESQRKGDGNDEGDGKILLEISLPWALYISLCTIMVAKAFELLSYYGVLLGEFDAMPFWWFVLIVMAVFSLYWLWGWLTLMVWNRAIQHVQIQELTMELKINVVMFVAIYILPLALICALAPPDSYLNFLLFGAFAIVVIYYLIKTFLLFLSQKVSILQWFLYLCTVEIAPLALTVFLIIHLAIK